MFPKVVRVIPTEDYTVYVYFEDGKTVCYDANMLRYVTISYCIK